MAFPINAILDAFTRANATDLGTDWTLLANNGVDDRWEVVSNQAKNTVNGFCSDYWDTTEFAADQECYATVATKPPDGQLFELYVRIQDENTSTWDGYVIRVAPASGTDVVSLRRYDNGASTLLGASFSQEISNGDALGIEIVGTTPTAYYKASGGSWTSLGTRTDSTYNVLGYIGMRTNGLDTVVDDFGGGNLVTTKSPYHDDSTTITAATFSGITKLGHPTVIENTGDVWPLTWTAGDKLFGTYSDGRGFTGSTERSMAFAEISGTPTSHTGANFSSDLQPVEGSGTTGIKASGVLELPNGDLLCLVRNYNPSGSNYRNSQLYRSTNGGVNWTAASWFWGQHTGTSGNSFGYPSFVQMGQGYDLNTDGYVYILSPNVNDAYVYNDDIVLARVLIADVMDIAEYEYFTGTPASPTWGAFADRTSIFNHPDGIERPTMQFHEPSGRYILIAPHDDGLAEAHSRAFGMYEAPAPWGPFKTIHYASDFAAQGRWAMHYSLPPKWHAGFTAWLTFSGQEDLGTPANSWNMLIVREVTLTFTQAAESGIFTCIGTDAGLRATRIMAATNGAYALTGTAATLNKGYTLVAAGGMYTLSGTATTFSIAYRIGALSGTYVLSGTEANLEIGYHLNADSGSFALTGAAAALRRDYPLTAAPGTYTLSGTDAALKVARKLSADSGTFTLTGNDAGLNFSGGNPVLVANSGTFTLTGSDAALRVDRRVSAASGAFALTGTAANLLATRLLGAMSGFYALIGTVASLEYGRLLSAASGTYVLTGQDATLVFSGGNPVIAANSGTFALSGTATTFRIDYRVAALGASYAINGTAAALLRQYPMVAVSGSFILTGQAATFPLTRGIAAENGAYALSGTTASLERGFLLIAASGSYALAGNDVAFGFTLHLAAGTGIYTITGQDVTLIATGGTAVVLFRAKARTRTFRSSGRAFTFTR